MSCAGQRGVLRFMVVAGTTYTVMLVAKAATHVSGGRSGDGNGMNCCVEKETENEKRSLRDAHYEMFRDQTEASLHGDHEWHPLQDRRGPTDHSHESMHMHNRHSYNRYGHNRYGHNNAYGYKNDKNDYYRKDNDSDDKKDDKKDDKNDDDDDDDDDDDSEHKSSSDQKMQSSDLDSINLGNTITIVNIGTVSQEPGIVGPSDIEPIGNVLAPGDTGRVALTAAARAFCGSVGCNSSQGSPSIDANSSSTILPPTTRYVAASNATRDNDGSAVSNGSSRVTIGLAKWLLLVAILIELLRF
ncbi:hypothetical protein KXD40_005916 [Peronospora effusa]|nr:hypothetical protein KXD40_005916 [Peronospora effusa]